MTRTLNLGILAHVDAGKTTLTERLLYSAGVIDEIGSVDDGSTQTDSLALERQRGITIKSAVASFTIDDIVVNLIDTPGHPDFIAEVERVLSVLDGVVLVVSAVEGVQAQTRVLMRALQRLKIPTLIFVNKIDRAGADGDGVVEAISERLTPSVVPLGKARDLGARGAKVVPFDATDDSFRSALADRLSDHNDALLAAIVNDEQDLSYRDLHAELAAQTEQSLIHPVFFGSAITGAGTGALIAGIRDLLPATAGDADGAVAGSVFKVDRGQSGEKIAYIRMRSGTMRTRDVISFGDGLAAKVTAISVFDHGGDVRKGEVMAGQIAKVRGLGDVQIGDAIGTSRTTDDHHFAPPTLETAVVPDLPSDKGRLHTALTQLAEQDPLINVRQDDVRQELYVSLYGEVQKEVIQATLALEFGLDVSFKETTVICLERPIGTGAAIEVLGKDGNPYAATVGLRVVPAPSGAGVQFSTDVDVRSIPIHVFKTVDEFQHSIADAVKDTLLQGLYGWEVTDCSVTMTHSGFVSPGTSAADFRKLTPLVVMSALRHAGTVVCEPIQRFHLDAPADALGPMLGVLARLGATPLSPVIRGSSFTLEGTIAAARMHDLQRQIPAHTQGEGAIEFSLDAYRPVNGRRPTRPRTDSNPLNRKEYLLHIERGV